jgi:uncharacterized protein YndB with AHSA1/START domain
VFDAWLDPAIARRWLFATATRPLAQVGIDPRNTGSFRFVERLRGKTIEHRGRYVEIVPHWRLAFTLSVENHPDVVARVTVAIAPATTGCALTLTHEGVPRDCAEHTRARWTGMLHGLGVTLETTGWSPDSLRAPAAAAPVPPSIPAWSPR